jgi:hypothetical protein
MIAKITRGHDMPGLIRYLFSPGKANEHRDQRVIASSEVLTAPHGVELDWTEVRLLGRSLDLPRADHAKEMAGGHVWHLSLSNRANERPLTDEQWAEIATGAMDAMGFTEASGKAPCRWAAIGHGRSKAGNDHIHIAVSLVRENGTVASVWQDRVKMSRYCAEMERRYELTIVHQEPGVGLPGVTRAEQERAQREGRVEPDRTALARTVRSAAVASNTEAEFVRRLRRSDLLTRPRYAEGGRDRVVGYSVALRAAGDAKPIWFGGGKLAADLTLPRLREYWEASATETARAVAEWGGRRRAPADAREGLVAGPERWMAAAEAVEDTYRRLAQLPVDDPALWSGAARESAGVFAAWSKRLEGSNPGPLAKAADALARSAQSPRSGPMPRRQGVPAFRGVAAIVTQALLSEDSTLGWAVLIAQLARTVHLLAEVHVAADQRFQAERLVAISTGELQRLQDRFNEVTMAELMPHEAGQVSKATAVRRPLMSPEQYAAAASDLPFDPGHDVGR